MHKYFYILFLLGILWFFHSCAGKTSSAIFCGDSVIQGNEECDPQVLELAMTNVNGMFPNAVMVSAKHLKTKRTALMTATIQARIAVMA